MALADFESSSEFSDVERIVLRYAVALTQTPVEVSDDLFDQLKRQFNERQLVEFYLSHRLGELPRAVQSRVRHRGGRFLGRGVLRAAGAKSIGWAFVHW